jgi:cell division protein FtsN
MDLLKQDLKSADGKYFVTGGAYITEKLAYAEGLRWQKLGYDVCLMSVKNSSLTKVVLGRFKSEKMASLFVENISEMPSGTISVEELTFKW